MAMIRVARVQFAMARPPDHGASAPAVPRPGGGGKG